MHNKLQFFAPFAYNYKKWNWYRRITNIYVILYLSINYTEIRYKVNKKLIFS